MAYITDAAREYAKKKAKDEKFVVITKEEEDMFNEMLEAYGDFEADIMKNDNTRMIITGDKNEYLQDIIDHIKALGHGFVVSSFKDGNVINGKQQAFCEVRKLAGHDNDTGIEYEFLMTSAEEKKLRQMIRQLVIDKHNALMTMNKAYKDFMEKWDDRFEDICKQYDLGYPGAYNDYLIELQDLDDTLGIDMKPLTEDEINERINDLLGS